MKKVLWLLWAVLCLALLAYFGNAMIISEDKSEFLIGDTTYGHYQIEMECTACHTEAFGGTEILQDACTNCHAEELEEARDSHPKKKFTDPRNADRLEVVDARYCVSCHTEHHKEKTLEMGLTLPKDYCYHCHQEIADERDSHKDLAFDSCASAGCHNYHDNRALYESFLVDNSGGEWLKAIASVQKSDSSTEINLNKHPHNNLPETQEIKTKIQENSHIHEELLMNKHGEMGVTCAGCHISSGEKKVNSLSVGQHEWIVKPGIESCASCHEGESETYMQGKHGMRIAQGLSGITPKNSHHEFSENAMTTEHSCLACHSAHDFSVEGSSVERCLGCHADEHSVNFLASPHGLKYLESPNSDETVTCATCHMPITEYQLMSGKVVSLVDHNQSSNLKPNEKMIRPVCMSCHNLEFSIDALADPELIRKNFSGKPSRHVPSIDWAIENLQ